MLNLLNAVDFFGKTLERTNATVAKGSLIAVLVLLSIVALLLLVYLVKLLINASHTEESSADIPLVNDENEPSERYLPNTVAYSETVADKATMSAPQAEVEQIYAMATMIDSVIAEDETEQAGGVRYDRSFTSRLIQAQDQVKSWYTDIKNELLSYKKVSHRISWHCETFRWHRQPIARLVFRGKTLCLLLSANVQDYLEKFHAEDVSSVARYVETPLMLRLKNNRRVKNAKLLIGDVMEQNGIQHLAQHQYVDYYVPYEGVDKLIDKGLIKRRLTSKRQEAFLTHNSGTTY